MLPRRRRRVPASAFSTVVVRIKVCMTIFNNTIFHGAVRMNVSCAHPTVCGGY